MNSNPDVVAALVATTARTRSAFTVAIADPAAADQPYAAGKWTARQVLCHIADTECVFLDRLRRVLAEAQPLLWSFDENRWAEHLDYAHAELTDMHDLYAANRNVYLSTLRRLGPDDWQRTGVHNVVGTVSVTKLVEKTLWHDDHHRAQAEAALAGRTWSKS